MITLVINILLKLPSNINNKIIIFRINNNNKIDSNNNNGCGHSLFAPLSNDQNLCLRW